jgi:hypothetical protein
MDMITWTVIGSHNTRVLGMLRLWMKSRYGCKFQIVSVLSHWQWSKERNSFVMIWHRLVITAHHTRWLKNHRLQPWIVKTQIAAADAFIIWIIPLLSIRTNLFYLWGQAFCLYKPSSIIWYLFKESGICQFWEHNARFCCHISQFIPILGFSVTMANKMLSSRQNHGLWKVD